MVKNNVETNVKNNVETMVIRLTSDGVKTFNSKNESIDSEKLLNNNKIFIDYKSFYKQNSKFLNMEDVISYLNLPYKYCEYDEFKYDSDELEKIKKLIGGFIYEQELHYKYNYEEITWENFVKIFIRYINISDNDFNYLKCIILNNKHKNNPNEKNSAYAWCYNINQFF